MHTLRIAYSSRRMRLALRAARPALCFVLLLGVQASTQKGTGQTRGQLSQPLGGQNLGDPGPADVDSIWREKQLRALNVERQKALVTDTNKLFKLAHDLDAQVSSANSDALTTEQIHNLAEIEKLAHSVKEKMITSVRGVPGYHLDAPPHMR